MRVKFWEWLIGIMFTLIGCYMIWTKDYEIRGHPVYPWVSYLILVLGIAIPILAYFFRSRNQANEKC